jgi:pyruvate carboxylase subunit B
MIFAPNPKNIHVTLTAFHDGLQGLFGGKVRVNNLLPAVRAAVAIDIRHLEFGSYYRAFCSHAGENPFIGMDQIREAAGPDTDLQISTHSISGVTVTPQRLATLETQARLMKKHGATIVRNVDFMNDVDNLVKTGKPIVEAGMHHQVCIAMMGVPYPCNQAHTPEFYTRLVQKLLESGLRFDSVCMNDATGTTTPHTCYETAKGLKKILPPEIPLSMRTCDTASLAIAGYMAGIAGGVDGIDLSVRPLASSVTQPDVRSMTQALKGTGYLLDIDASKVDQVEQCLVEGLRDHAFNPAAIAPDARVVRFPMSGDAIAATIEDMTATNLLHRYEEVLAEFGAVAQAGGVWASIAPGDQHYWSQALNNVVHGRWARIDPGYGRSILGYFGHPPHKPDPAVVKIAAEQLQLEPCIGNPLEQAPDSMAMAEDALREHTLPITEENLFLVAAAITSNASMELNAGIRLLTGQTTISAPLEARQSASVETISAPAPATLEDPTLELIAPTEPAPKSEPDPRSAASSFTQPVTTQCTVVEGDMMRIFQVTIEPPQ